MKKTEIKMESIVSLKSIGIGVEAEITVSKGAEWVSELASFVCAEEERAEKETLLGLDRLSEINSELQRLNCDARLSDYTLSSMCGVLAGRLSSVVGKTNKLRYGNVKKKKSEGRELSDSLSVLLGDKKLGVDGTDNDDAAEGDGNAPPMLLGDGNVSLLPPGDGRAEEGEFVFSEEWLSDVADECGEIIPDRKKRFSASRSLLGLVLSVSEQFSNNPDFRCEDIGLALGVNSKGYFVSPEKNGKIYSGILNWFFAVAEEMSGEQNTEKFDFKGSRVISTFLTHAYELSRLSLFKDTGWRERLRCSFFDFASGKDGERFRAELNAIFRKEEAGGILKKQRSVVTFNEMLVRAVFFVRRFINEMREKHSLSLIGYSDLIPERDRTLSRMLSVSFGVFTAVDVTRAALKSAAKGGASFLPKFLFDTVLKVNIAGIGRFALELKDEADLFKEREVLRDERLKLCGEVLAEYSTAVFYRQAGMWGSAEDTVRTLSEVSRIAERAVDLHVRAISEMTEDIKDVSEKLSGIKDEGSGLFSELSDILKYE